MTVYSMQVDVSCLPWLFELASLLSLYIPFSIAKLASSARIQLKTRHFDNHTSDLDWLYAACRTYYKSLATSH
jgi:hypothetical protein